MGQLQKSRDPRMTHQLLHNSTFSIPSHRAQNYTPPDAEAKYWRALLNKTMLRLNNHIGDLASRVKMKHTVYNFFYSTVPLLEARLSKSDLHRHNSNGGQNCYKKINFENVQKDSPPNKFHNRNLYGWCLSFYSAIFSFLAIRTSGIFNMGSMICLK